MINKYSCEIIDVNSATSDEKQYEDELKCVNDYKEELASEEISKEEKEEERIYDIEAHIHCLEDQIADHEVVNIIIKKENERLKQKVKDLEDKRVKEEKNTKIE